MPSDTELKIKEYKALLKSFMTALSTEKRAVGVTSLASIAECSTTTIIAILSFEPPNGAKIVFLPNKKYHDAFVTHFRKLAGENSLNLDSKLKILDKIHEEYIQPEIESRGGRGRKASGAAAYNAESLPVSESWEKRALELENMREAAGLPRVDPFRHWGAAFDRYMDKKEQSGNQR